jgi:signal transduction histidine kinase
MTPADLAQLATEARALLDPMARKAGVSLVQDEPQGTHRATVDHAQIHQVLTNLVLNGIQACGDGGQVRVALEEVSAVRPGDGPDHQQRYHVISVRDDGVGIAEEDLEHIFDPFFTRKDVGAGTGLGLSIAQGIVHDHGGWIAVDSATGEGSVFRVYLPADLQGSARRGAADPGSRA